MSKSLITEPLGLYGWNRLEPILLASLITEQPLLLVGKHGCAKSFLLERLAEALKLNFRSYNASLINYDDLVGIPIPTSDNKSLEYISSPNSIWDAEVVFIDEINRTKPELQNKLFPIIYDKRIQGEKLDKLHYRWAAMNPPVSEEDDELTYIGTEPLDPALADRFPYVLEVPSWDELSDIDKENILIDQFKGRHEFPIDINELIKKGREVYRNVLNTKHEIVSNYIISLMNLLKNSLGYFSPRRATMMQESLLAIYAANIVLGEFNNEVPSTLEDCAILHIECCLPNLANQKLDKALLISIVNNALKLSSLVDSAEKTLLLKETPLEKLKFAIKNKDELSNDILNDVIPSCLSQLDIYYRRALSLICYLKFRNNSGINAAVIETIGNDIRPILTCVKNDSLECLREKKLASAIEGALKSYSEDTSYYKYLYNYLFSFWPDDYIDSNQVYSVANVFVTIWEELMK